MSIHIRQEQSNDHEAVFSLIQQAFANETLSDHQEQFLVQRLRAAPTFVPALSLVAETDGQIVGHILLTPIDIKHEHQRTASLALAPVSVLPDYQGKGIGSRLIQAAHQQAAALDYSSVILLGHADYYPRFGYRRADHYGITLPFDVPAANCMALELRENGLRGVSGVVEYPAAFFA